MRVTFFSIALFSLLMVGCSEKETPGGIKYTVLKTGDGVEPALGQFLHLNMVLKRNDSVWFSTLTDGPLVMPVQDQSMTKAETEFGVFKALTKGDCVTFQLPANTVFFKTRRRKVPEKIKPEDLFTYTVWLKEVWSQAQADAFKQEQTAQAEAKQRAADDSVIREHLAKNNIQADTTSSGLYYVITKQGTGPLAASGKIVKVLYKGYFLDGEVFDTNMKSTGKENNINKPGLGDPYSLVVNTGSVITGWDEILQRMNKGMKITVFIPSYLGYGPYGSGKIPPNTVLAFDMELVDLK